MWKEESMFLASERAMIELRQAQSWVKASTRRYGLSNMRVQNSACDCTRPATALWDSNRVVYLMLLQYAVQMASAMLLISMSRSAISHDADGESGSENLPNAVSEGEKWTPGGAEIGRAVSRPESTDSRHKTAM